VLRVGAAEPVHRLGVVAHAGQPVPLRPQQPHDLCLHRVDVLALVHQDSVEQAAQGRPGGGIGQRRLPQQQQVVEIDQRVRALAGHVGAEQPGQLLPVLAAPGEAGRDHLPDRELGVHAPAVDVGADRGARCPPVGAGQAVVGAQRVQHVRDVGGVDDAERGRQRERLGVRPDDPVRHRVKRPPADPPARGGRRHRRDPGQHVVGGAAGERQQQDPAGLDALGPEPRGACDQRAGLAGSRPGQHQQRPARVRRGPALGVVELVEHAGRFEHGHERSEPGLFRPVPAPQDTPYGAQRRLVMLPVWPRSHPSPLPAAVAAARRGSRSSSAWLRAA
jgi:hypothetical protein